MGNFDAVGASIIMLIIQVADAINLRDIPYNGYFSNTLIYENKHLPRISKKYLRKWEGSGSFKSWAGARDCNVVIEAAGNRGLPLILSLCQGVMATLHSTEFSMEFIIRGHHTYKYIWSSIVGEELECRIETGNVHHFVTKLRKFIFENGPKFSKFS